MDHGVSIQFLASASKALEKQYGERLAEPAFMNEFAHKLGEAERAFLKLPKAEPQARKRKS